MGYLSNEITELHKGGLSQKKIAVQLNCGITTVRRRMKELGLVSKSKGTRTYKINEDIFAEIDTQDKAYWLGFMLADGCIAKSAKTRRTIRVSLQKRDERHLRKLAAFFNYRGKFFDDSRKGHVRKVIVFNSVILCSHLIQKGWLEYKESGDCRVFGSVPTALFRHLIRGYFDGDGCISRRKKAEKSWYANIVCKHGQPLIGFNNFISAEIGINRVVKPPKENKPRSVHRLVWNGRNQLMTLCDWLYQDATEFLGRKRIRFVELSKAPIFTFNSIHDFNWTVNTDELTSRIDRDDVINNFSNVLLSSGWCKPVYDIDEELQQCKGIDPSACICDDGIMPKLGIGNKIILHFQPVMWEVAQNNKPSIASFVAYPNTLKRAVDAFAKSPGKKMYPERLIRELLFAGFTRASILGVPVIMAFLRKAGLSGTWFDPCAGWGNRLLAAHLMNNNYIGSDPGICYDGLVRIKDFLGSNAVLVKERWQDVKWSDSDFVFTSPPFYNKENYLDNVEYGKFDDWMKLFVFPLIDKSKQHAKRAIFHVDTRIKDAISAKHQVNLTKLLPRNRHKMPMEWFVEIM
jgi:hypothetical protein